MIKRNVYVTNADGEAVRPGTPIADFRGEVWTFKGVTRVPEGPSTGRVYVTRKCSHGQGRCPFWCSGVEHGEFYPSVFNLKITAK